MKRFLSKYSWENIFYLLSAGLLASPFVDFKGYSHSLENVSWEFPLNLFYPSTLQGYSFLVNACIAVFLGMALSPKRWPFLGFFTWMMALALMNSFGKHSHASHGWAMAALGMTIAHLIDPKDNRLRLDYAIVAGTSIYCVSGLWKLRVLLGTDDVILAAQRGLPSQMTYGLAEHYRSSGIQLLQWFQSHPSLSALVWMTVIITQIFTPIGILIFDRWRFLLVVVLILFHVGAQWTVGPAFSTQKIFLAFMGAVSFYYEWWRPGRVISS